MSDAPDYTLPVSITGITITSLPVDIIAQTIASLAIDIVAQTLGNLDINIAASAITLDVDVTNAYINVRTEAAQNLRVDIVAQAVGNLGVDIKAQTVGNLAINIAAQSLGTVAISIAAQVVDLNIKTSGGTNIVIDKLTQTAYTERRPIVSNHGVTPSWSSKTGTNMDGKFFPRGMRGFVNVVRVYCRDSAAAGGTFTVYLAPFPGAGYLYTGTIAVPAGGSAGWREWAVYKMWEYDSMFIWIVSSVADIQYGYDEGTPYDHYSTTDAGASWVQGNYRLFIELYMVGQTIGDLPVSGTLNVVHLPHSAAMRAEASVLVTKGVETTIVEAYGLGYCEYFIFYVHGKADSDDTFMSIWVDGAAVFTENPSTMSLYGFDPSTPGMALTTCGADVDAVIVVTTRIEFRRHFRVTATNYLSNQLVDVDAIVNLIR